MPGTVWRVWACWDASLRGLALDQSIENARLDSESAVALPLERFATGFARTVRDRREALRWSADRRGGPDGVRSCALEGGRVLRGRGPCVFKCLIVFKEKGGLAST